VFDHVMWQVGQERHSELPAIAEGHRLVSNKAFRLGRKERLLINVGDFLISFGTRLKEQYKALRVESSLPEVGISPICCEQESGKVWSHQRIVLI